MHKASTGAQRAYRGATPRAPSVAKLRPGLSIKTVLLGLLCLAIPLSAGLLLIRVRTQTVLLGYRLDSAQRLITKLAEENQRLKLERASLTASGPLRAHAEALGLKSAQVKTLWSNVHPDLAASPQAYIGGRKNQTVSAATTQAQLKP